jgi:hypothetical protein
MRILLAVPLLAACAHLPSASPADAVAAQYELARAIFDVEAPFPSDELGTAFPCVSGDETPSRTSLCRLVELSSDEAAAFSAEAARLERDPNPICRRLGEAIENHLADVEMYENAIVHQLGPYRFYGVGHSYQYEGRWTIRVARRLDELNDRTMDEKTRTLRHEMSHTIGAPERRVRHGWSAADYAEQCG